MPFLCVMAKQFLVCILLVLGLALTCRATLYNVGDSSGWDISTDVDTWAQNKRFVVGDVLLFQYASTHSVNEVTKQDYQGCTTGVLQSSSNGNTSFPLTTPGDKYFICGNKLHCLGGMKLHVLVEGNPAAAPAPAPGLDSDSGTSTSTSGTPSSKSNTANTVASSSAPDSESGTSISTSSTPSSKSNTANTVASSSAPVFVRGGVDSLVLVMLGFVAGSILLSVV